MRSVNRTVLTANSTDFLLYAELDAYEGEHEQERRVLSDNRDYAIPRDLN